MKEEKKYETLIFKREKILRRSKNILWKNHLELLSKNKKYFSKSDKIKIRELLYNTIPSKYRSEYWFIATGAKLEYLNKKGYYQKLLNLSKNNKNILNSSKTQYNLKTQTHLNFIKDKKNMEKLNNILNAFQIRNNLKENYYFKGLISIAEQILLVINDEEKAFWILIKIIEDYLPFNYYVEIIGVKINISIAYSIIKINFIEISEELKLCINNLLCHCFISLFSEIFEPEILRIIWDAFFLLGDVILFRTFRFISFFSFDDKIKKLNNAESVFQNIKNKLFEFNNYDLLNYFLLVERLITNSFIDEYRKRKRQKLMKQMENNNIFNKPLNNKKILFPDYKVILLKKIPKRINNYFYEKIKNKYLKNNKCNIIDNEDDILIEK